MNTLSKREKEIWNEAIRKTLVELQNWDGIIPDKTDRKILKDSIYERVAYKIKHREYF